MSDFTKKPLGRSLNDLAVARAKDALSQTGRGLPCVVSKVISSGIVTVNFQVTGTFTIPQVTIPIEYPEYIRYPIQVGDKGMTVAADTRLGPISGLGGTTASLNQPANLTGLSFVWLGNTGWSPTDDPMALVLYGPNGVIMRDTGSTASISVTPGNVAITGVLTINGVPFLAHEHSGVQAGSSNTGGVV